MNWIVKSFSELTTEELYEILKLRNDVFIVEQSCPYLDIDGKDKESYHLFLKDRNKIVAYLRILKKGVSYKEPSIGRVLVRNDYRRKSISREMLLKGISFIENTLKEKEIKIQAESYLENFYSSLGFKKLSDSYLLDNIPHIDMLYKK